MAEGLLLQGNEALARGAAIAGCDAFFGYPITPANEVCEWFAQEYDAGRVKLFIQSPSETATINMLYGAAAIGARVLTSTSGPGWGLMQETISHCAEAQLPIVIAQVQRGAPGQGTIRHGQLDYLSATRGGGQGGYKTIVLAPDSVQENCDLVQLAFYLADKYRNPAVVLTDAVIGQMLEPVEIRRLDFGPLEDKEEWILKGVRHRKDGTRRHIICAGNIPSPDTRPQIMDYLGQMEILDKKWRDIEASEVRYESYYAEDAKLILVAIGYTARVAKEAVHLSRAQGLAAGLIRPITVWPFPYQAIREKASQGCDFLVVEDNLGQMLEDVKLAVEGRAKIHFIGLLARHARTGEGVILPGRVFSEVKKILGGESGG